jgi:hypothetical protein
VLPLTGANESIKLGVLQQRRLLIFCFAAPISKQGHKPPLYVFIRFSSACSLSRSRCGLVSLVVVLVCAVQHSRDHKAKAVEHWSSHSFLCVIENVILIGLNKLHP